DWRARLNAASDSALARSARSRRAKALGQDDLFGGQDLAVLDPVVELPAATAWTDLEMLTAEKKALGFYITGHPLAAHQETMTVRVRTHPSLKIQGSVEIESALRALGCEVIWQGVGAPARAVAATTAN